MSKYIIISSKAEQFQDQKYLLFYLQKLNPAIEIQAALVVTVPQELDCLIQSLDGIPVAAPASIDAKALADKAAATIRRRREKSTGRILTSMICSQCGKERVSTKSGICKPCSMVNAKVARKNGKQIITPAPVVGNEEKKINAATRLEPHLITRHGPIKGKKLA